MLFGLFETAPYWKLKDLTSHVKQPQAYLKEVLSDIAKLVARGPYLGMYTLTDQYKVGGVKPEVKSEVALRPGEVKPEELDDNEDDEEMVEVVG
jgi:transcription initiation factor TFIIF subunit beta